MKQEDLNKILEAAAKAPSGDNVQPWRFEIIGDNSDRLKVYNDPAVDNSLYNYRQTASFIAHGALIKNIEIAALHLGYTCNYADVSGQPNLVADITLTAVTPQPQELYESIFLRATNRKPYRTEKILSQITDLANRFGSSNADPQIKIIDDPALVEQVAAIVSLNEKLVLENYYLHKFLFDHVTWNAGQASAHPQGLYLKTLEISKPAEIVFKIASKWSRVTLFNRFGLSKKVAKENFEVYKKSGGFAAVLVNSAEQPDLLGIGKIIQEFWLSLTKRGFYAHPLTGIIFLNHAIELGIQHYLSEKEITEIKKAYVALEDLFGAKGKHILFLMRIGTAAAPSAYSGRISFKSLMKS